MILRKLELGRGKSFWNIKRVSLVAGWHSESRSFVVFISYRSTRACLEPALALSKVNLISFLPQHQVRASASENGVTTRRVGIYIRRGWKLGERMKERERESATPTLEIYVVRENAGKFSFSVFLVFRSGFRILCSIVRYAIFYFNKGNCDALWVWRVLVASWALRWWVHLHVSWSY